MAVEGADKPLGGLTNEYSAACRGLQYPLTFKDTIFTPTDCVQQAGCNVCPRVNPAGLVELQNAGTTSGSGVR
jgi:hypothetical protein